MAERPPRRAPPARALLLALAGALLAPHTARALDTGASDGVRRPQMQAHLYAIS
ncbi:hypothetical protein ACRRTK_011098 [Alexandromys fortis]